MAGVERRVVITGIGLITPLGNDAANNWQGLAAGRSGVGPITHFDASALPVRIAGEVRDFDPLAFIDKKDVKKMDAFSHYAVAAAQQAVADAGLRIEPERAGQVGVVVGVGMGGIATIEDALRDFLAAGVKRVSPFFVPRLIGNMAPAHIAMRFGAKGINYTTTSACASGGHAVGEAYRLVRSGLQEVMLAGGAEAAITPMGVAGFAVMRALSTRNEDPGRASRPFDRERDGFVIGEGSGMLVLESREAALQRGAHVYAEIIGYGANSDAYHITTPSPEGEGAMRCMQLALAEAGIAPADVDYINAHGTSTPYNDANETRAIKRAFGAHAARLAVSSTKSMTGHLLGGAGAVEVVYTALSLRHGLLPPTINYEHPDPECDLDYVPNRARRMPIRVALSNSFGFGGTNVCLALRRHADGADG